jgi:hypothetical protein
VAAARRDPAPAAQTLASPGAPASLATEGRPNARTAACPLHQFAPWKPRVVRCERCGLGLDEDCAAWYRRGVEHGRADAWARPDGPQRGPRARAVAVLFAFAMTLVGAAPQVALPPPPPHEALLALGHCLEAAGTLEGDVTAVWGRQLAARCPDDGCRALAAAEAASNRAPTRAASDEAAGAQRSLARALGNAIACAESRVPGCVDYAPAILAERRGELERASKTLAEKVRNARLSTDTARP